MEEKEIKLPERDLLEGKSVLRRFILGVLFGLAVIAPGVSGSTIAIMMGLYTAMLYALGHLFSDFRRALRFLLPLGIGALLGFFGGFFIIQKVFADYTMHLICLFAGLMMGAVPALTKELRGERATPARLSLMALGVALPILVALLSAFLLPESSSTDTFVTIPVWLYFAYLPLGFLLSVTQLVPGLSATVVLMAFGQFGPILNSVHREYIFAHPEVLLLYLSLVVGFAFGILSLSRLLSHLLEAHKASAFYTVVGLSVGSIVSMFLSSDAFTVYRAWSTYTPLSFFLGALLLLTGFAISFLLVLYEKRHDISVK